MLKYLETFSDARVPHRRMWTNIRDAIDDINVYATFSNVSVSIWNYRQCEQKYNRVGQKTRVGPKYSTAVTNCIFFDIDCFDREGKTITHRESAFQNLWKWAKKNDFKREVAFTGGGYQVVIGANIYPEIYESTILQVKDLIHLDDNEPIELAKMKRVVGSYNWGNDKKSKRDRYCISLTEKEIELGLDYHIEASQKQRNRIYRYGENKFKPRNVKTSVKKRKLDRKSDFKTDASTDDVLEKYGWSYETLCPNIRAMIEQPTVGHRDRMEIIKYLKTICCIKYGDIIILLPKILTARHGMTNDGAHSVEEGQPDSIYSRGLWFNPRRMKELGFCDIDCKVCEEFIKEMKNI